ncbi:hypothetical protein [Glycomyces niveus]|nr:hypothetical protein [Glycomyces sp. NEAU-S30]
MASKVTYPGATRTRLGEPVARILQSRATDRFVKAMRDACARA